MSSYQHQCMLGNVMRDSHPDFLTCGYCAKEFLLDNITMFIAHKTGGCDQGIHSRSTTLHDTEDTSAPLTCSTCSRVFMTARGLLHHVQEEHQMVLCLQKGPLFLPHKEMRPPPAHSSLNGAEFTRTQAGGPGFCLPRSVSSCVQNDQPTDLSLTCSNSLAKARITCNDDKCKITIEPTCSVNSSRPPSALPKKRRFLFSQQSPGFEREEFGYPSACDIGGRIGDGYEDVDSSGSYENSDPTNGKQMDRNDVSICVTAEYQEDTLCCVSLSTEKKEHDKHAKLKRLLQNKIPATEPETFPQESDAKTTTVVYKVPFLAPSDPESAILKATANETSGKHDSHKENSTPTSITDTEVTSSNMHKGNTVPRLAMDTNIDRIIRSSISSDAFSEELDMLSIHPELSLSSSRQPKHDRLDDLGTPMSSSPRLVMPGENNTSSPRMSISCPSLDDTEKGSINSNFEHWNNTFLSDDPNLYTAPGNPSIQPAVFLGIKSLRTGIPQNESVKLKNSSGLAGRSPTPISEKSTKEVYSDISLLRNHQNDQSSKQLCDSHTIFGEGLLRLLERKKTSHSSQVQSQFLEPAVSMMGDLAGGNQSIQHWLNTHNEDNTNISGIGSTSRPTSAHFDAASQENVEQTCPDIQDETSGDSKGIKRRRYPTSRPFKCPNCDQAFNQRIHLKKHMSKHTGVKPFKCQQCDYSTVERSHLKVHYRIHTGEKPYRCMFCDYATAQNSTLKIHMKRHHETPTSDCSNLRDTYQPTGSYDDENWTLQDNYFLNPSMNTPALDDELHRSPFLPGSRASHSLPIENSSLCQMGDGDTRAGSSSPLTPTDQKAETQMYATSMKQVQTADHVAGRTSFLEAERSSRRQLTLTSCGHINSIEAPRFKTTVVKSMNSNLDTATDVLFKGSIRQGKEELGSHSSEDSRCFVDSSKTAAFEDINSSSVQVFMIQTENKLQSKNEDLYYLNSKAQLHAKSFTTRKQIARKDSIQTSKSMKSPISELEVNSVIEKDVPEEKELIHVFNNNKLVPQKNEHTSSEVNATETFTSKENMESNSLLVSELIGDDVEDDEFECNSVDTVPVTIPNKAFVRG